jgi:hypothetical protein
LLAALPDNRSTRLNVARVVGEYAVPDATDESAKSFTQYRNVDELGGFIATGPIAISEITSRFGAGEYRVSAYALDAPDCGGKCSRPSTRVREFACGVTFRASTRVARLCRSSDRRSMGEDNQSRADSKVFTEAEYRADPKRVVAHAVATGSAIVARDDGTLRVVISIHRRTHRPRFLEACETKQARAV